MLRRGERLSTKDFKAIMAGGRASHSSLFSLRTMDTDGRAKLSAVAPQSAARTAALRNRTRRRIYAALRPLYPSVKTDTRTIIFAKSPAVKASFAELKAALREIFVKAGLLK